MITKIIDNLKRYRKRKKCNERGSAFIPILCMPLPLNIDSTTYNNNIT